MMTGTRRKKLVEEAGWKKTGEIEVFREIGRS